MVRIVFRSFKVCFDDQASGEPVKDLI